jgi:hypothetical protein
MIEVLCEQFPDEIVWNIIKYTEHPCSAMIKKKIEQVFEPSYRIFNLGGKSEYKNVFDFYYSSIDEYTFYYKFRYADRDMKHNGTCRECGLNGRRLDWDTVHLEPDESIIDGICFTCQKKIYNDSDSDSD